MWTFLLPITSPPPVRGAALLQIPFFLLSRLPSSITSRAPCARGGPLQYFFSQFCTFPPLLYVFNPRTATLKPKLEAGGLWRRQAGPRSFPSPPSLPPPKRKLLDGNPVPSCSEQVWPHKDSSHNAQNPLKILDMPLFVQDLKEIRPHSSDSAWTLTGGNTNAATLTVTQPKVELRTCV